MRPPTGLSTRSTSEWNGAEKNRRRADIQGLRALAVALVVADHVAGRPSGGFLGVDVFFVISGFLITGILVREHERSGRISLVDFYRRRIKRILPAALTVLVVVVGLTRFLLTPARRSGIRDDAIWSAFSLGNWRMVSLGTDYQHATDAVSPLQHYWSLGVEEQFYLVWPLLLLGVAAAAWAGGTARRRAALSIAVLSAVSIGYGAWETAAHPTVAYFSTFSRGWELGAGALLALAANRLRGLGPVTRNTLSAVGLGAIALATLIVDPGSPNPVPGALLPVAGTAAVIASGIGGAPRASALLTNRVASWLGERSYSLYLWHFPLVVFVGVLLPAHDIGFVAATAMLSLLAAAFSYRFIEEPFRRRSWRRWRSTGLQEGSVRRPVATAIALLTAAAAVVVLIFASRTPPTFQPVAVTGLFPAAASSTALAGRQQAVTTALAATRWPRLDPAPARLGPAARAPEWIVDGCLGDDDFAPEPPVPNATRCTYGLPTARHTAVLLGDSVAISWMPGLRSALGADWRIEVWTDRECPAVAVNNTAIDGSAVPNCGPMRRAAEERIRRISPDLTILSSSPASLSDLVSGAKGAAAEAEWRAATARTLGRLAPLTGRLVLLDPPPDMRTAADCAALVSGPRYCVAPVDSAYLRVHHAQAAALAALGRSNLSYPSTLPWFCASDGRCPSFVGTSPTVTDGRHLTDSAARDLAPLLRSALGLPGPPPGTDMPGPGSGRVVEAAR